MEETYWRTSWVGSQTRKHSSGARVLLSSKTLSFPPSTHLEKVLQPSDLPLCQQRLHITEICFKYLWWPNRVIWNLLIAQIQISRNWYVGMLNWCFNCDKLLEIIKSLLYLTQKQKKRIAKCRLCCHQKKNNERQAPKAASDSDISPVCLS